jgi:glycosyltransferase involved in cell wall biosynthesis
MIFYLTFNDSPSGIYSSQVIDVVKFMRQELKANINLVAFISLRGFADNRKKILAELPGAVVLPMFPGVHRWRSNNVLLKLLCMLKRPEAIIGRSVLATHLGFATGVKNIIYDGRGAIAAEWKEYGVITEPTMLAEIDQLEREAVLRSRFRIGVSHELVKLWQNQFGYTKHDHVVIPCTLNKVFENLILDQEYILKCRTHAGFKASDIVLAYAGSLAGWQSFDLLYDFIAPLLQKDERIKLFFLAGPDKNILQLEKEFPGRITYKKVSPQEVPAYLSAADYGLLIREQSVTNQVASPVKFAEYLACGLKVIISDHLGDYSHFVTEHACGNHFYNVTQAEPVPLPEKQRLRQLALTYFTKNSLLAEYKSLAGQAV